MKIDVGIQLKMGQQLIMTPQLQNAIKLLQLSRQELEQLIDQSLVENPTLESFTEEENPSEENDPQEIPENYASADEALPKDEKEMTYEEEWREYVERVSGSAQEAPGRNNEESDSNPIESLSTYSGTLTEHLFRQLEMAEMDEEELEIANYVIGNIDDDGYLGLSIRHILASEKSVHDSCEKLLERGYAKVSEADPENPLFDISHKENKKEIEDFEFSSRKKVPEFIKEEERKRKNERPFWTEPEKITPAICAVVEKVLEKIQAFEPAGVGARNLQECLYLQIKNLGREERPEGRIVKDCMKLLTNKDVPKIARKLQLSKEEVIAAYHNIASLEPKPGRPFSSEKTQYVIPDVFVYKSNGEYKIRINEQGIPKLRISPDYLEMAERYQKMEPTGKKKQNNDEDEKSMTFLYLNEKIKAGEWLMKSIEQRQRTIYKVTESIVKNQQEFFESGIDALKPMVLKDVAEDIEVHESTVSRITTNKFMHTPQGIFELKYFFTSGIKQKDGEFISSKKIKDLIKKLIQEEEAKKPYTDEQLSIVLEKDLGIKVARRTVAKYREALNIMPSNKRKQLFD